MTKEERKTLKRMIEESIKDKLDNMKSITFYSYEEVLCGLDEDYLQTLQHQPVSHAAIGKILGEIATAYGYDYNKLTLRYFLTLSDIVEWKKEKNILTLVTNRNMVIKYDFNKNDFITNLPEHYIGDIKRCCEWVFNYKDLLPNNFSEVVYISYKLKDNNCPKGFINWLKENNKTLSKENYLLFTYLHNENLNNSKFKKQILESAMHGIEDYKYDYYIENAKLFDKIFFNNTEIMQKLFDNFFASAVRRFREMTELNFPIDDNRGIEYNYNSFKEWENANRNKILSERLQKLNFLNDMVIDDYIIKVPQRIEDLQNEGRQQNNCVGYYYNDSIVRGENAIYFIRKKENTKKSYITCRYNYEIENTVEYRLYNNRSVHEEKDLNAIKKITEIINSTIMGKC